MKLLIGLAIALVAALLPAGRAAADFQPPKTLTVAGLTLSRGRGLDGALPEVGGMVRVTGAAAGKADGSAALTVEPDPFNPFGTTVGALAVSCSPDRLPGIQASAARIQAAAARITRALTI